MQEMAGTITLGLWLGLIPLLLGYFAYWVGSSEVDARRKKLIAWIIPRYFVGLLVLSIGSYLVMTDKEQLSCGFNQFWSYISERANEIAGTSLWISVALAYIYLFAFRLRVKKRELEEEGNI